MHFTRGTLVALHVLSTATSTAPRSTNVRSQAVIKGDGVSMASTIRDVLIENRVIGDVLDDFEPSFQLDISYTRAHESVLLGNDIPVRSVSKRPVFTFHSLTPGPHMLDTANKVYTLALTDPDAKSRINPKWSEMCHWIVTNLTIPVPGDPPHGILKLLPGELEEYLPPGPPKKTGRHRYVFVLMEGDATASLTPPALRRHWGYGKERHGVRDWAAEHDLTIVGANFFFAQYERE